jgi:hypothetical protein
MATKKHRSGKPVSGGRVTPKGTQPPAAPGKPKSHDSDAGAPRAQPGRIDPTASRSSFGPIGPTRSGHHRGNR